MILGRGINRGCGIAHIFARGGGGRVRLFSEGRGEEQRTEMMKEEREEEREEEEEEEEFDEEEWEWELSEIQEERRERGRERIEKQILRREEERMRGERGGGRGGEVVRGVGRGIVVPFYVDLSADETAKKEKEQKITLWGEYEVEKIKKSCKLAKQILTFAGKCVKPGVTTDWIDEQIHNAILEAGAYPSPLLYQGFPKSSCISINECVIHGVPSPFCVLQDGDVVHIDITVYLNGFHGDCSDTFFCGDKIEPHLVRMGEVAREMVHKSVEKLKPLAPLTTIAEECMKIASKEDFFLVDEVAGHGIGSHFHTAPLISHTLEGAEEDPEGVFEEGMVFTIEPAILEFPSFCELWGGDNWSYLTSDGPFSASYEHTVRITADGCEILTKE